PDPTVPPDPTLPAAPTLPPVPTLPLAPPVPGPVVPPDETAPPEPPLDRPPAPVAPPVPDRSRAGAPQAKPSAVRTRARRQIGWGDGPRSSRTEPSSPAAPVVTTAVGACRGASRRHARGSLRRPNCDRRVAAVGLRGLRALSVLVALTVAL